MSRKINKVKSIRTNINKMKLTANITLDEMTKSDIAERKGINNNPSPKQIDNLKDTSCKYFTTKYVVSFDKPLIISVADFVVQN